MRNDTKLDVLWEQMGKANSELAAVKAVTDEVAPLISKIPKDYSATETDTGLKWIDGKEIYFKAFSGIAPESGYNLTVANITGYESLINFDVIVYNATNTNYVKIGANVTLTGDIRFPLSAAYFSQKYFGYVYYTKEAPTRGPDVEPETKKATKKKTTK